MSKKTGVIKDLKVVILREWASSIHNDVNLSPRHLHFIHIKSGSCKVRIQTQQRRLEEGDIIVIYRKQHFEILDEDVAQIESISVRKKFLSSFCSSVNNKEKIFTVDETVLKDHKLVPVSFQLVFRTLRTGLEKQFSIELLEELLIHVFKSNKNLNLAETKLSKIKASIKTRESEPIKLNILADNFLISKLKLVKGFIKYVGVTPHMYQILYLSEKENLPNFLQEMIKYGQIPEMLKSLVKN